MTIGHRLIPGNTAARKSAEYMRVGTAIEQPSSALYARLVDNEVNWAARRERRSNRGFGNAPAERRARVF